MSTAEAQTSSTTAPSTAAPAADAGNVNAQDDGLAEIVVTARKQTESLLHVPVAVSVISASELQRNDATDLAKIAELTPDVMIQRMPTGNGAIFNIRGIGSSYLDSGIEETVSVNIDGVQVGRGRIASEAQFDLQQVEVLKGPQALFFGKNSPAGVISITSEDPSGTLQGYARSGYEFDAHERFVEAAIGGPLADTLEARVAIRYDNTRGWIPNDFKPEADPLVPGLELTRPSTGYAPESKDITGRLSLVWKPMDGFSAKLKLTSGHETGNGEDSQQTYFCTNGNAHTTLLNILTGVRYVDYQNSCSRQPVRALAAFPAIFTVNYPGANGGLPYGNTYATLSSLTLDYTTRHFDVTSVTGYTDLNNIGSGLYDGTSFSSIYSVSAERSRTWSEELRTVSRFEGPLNFLLGGFFENSHRTDTYAAQLAAVGPDPATGKYYTFGDQYDSPGKTYSGYAQGRWSILDNLELDAGARYTHESKSIKAANNYLNPILGPAFGLLPVGETVTSNRDFSNVSPEVTLSYHPVTNSTIYAAYKTGYKSGGYSNPATLGSLYKNPALLSFGPETAKGFEVGAKGEFLDNRVRADFTVYRYNFNGLQVSTFNAAQIAYLIANAAQARTTGFETSVQWRATRELTLHADFAYNDAKYVSYPNAGCYAGQTEAEGCVGGGVNGATYSRGLTNRSGEPLERAPKDSFSTGFQYDRPITARLSFGISGDAFFTSKYYADDDGDPTVYQSAFWRFNAGARIYDSNDRWEVAFIGRNLSNKYYLISGNDKSFGLPGEYGGIFARPRELMLEVTYRF